MTAMHSLTAGSAIPGYVLRALLCVVTASASFVLLPETWLRFLPMALALIAAIVPGYLCAWLALALFPIGMLMTDPEPWRASLAVLAVHAIHVLGSLTLAIPARARVERRALIPTWIRFLQIQAVSQAVTLAALLLMPDQSVGFAWLAPVGAAVLLGLTALLLRPLNPR